MSDYRVPKRIMSGENNNARQRGPGEKGEKKTEAS